MSGRLSHCAQCGAPLPAPDAVCPKCDLELSSQTGSPAHGRYRCPHCSSRFDQPLQGWWPPNVPWYRPQDPKPQCPYCQAFLRDRTVETFSRAEWAGIWVVMFAVGTALPWALSKWPWAREQPLLRQLITLAAVFGVFWLLRSRRRRQARASIALEEERYALEERQR